MKKKLPQILVQFFKLLTIIYLAVYPQLERNETKQIDKELEDLENSRVQRK